MCARAPSTRRRARKTHPLTKHYAHARAALKKKKSATEETLAKPKKLISKTPAAKAIAVRVAAATQGP